MRTGHGSNVDLPSVNDLVAQLAAIGRKQDELMEEDDRISTSIAVLNYEYLSAIHDCKIVGENPTETKRLRELACLDKRLPLQAAEDRREFLKRAHAILESRVSGLQTAAKAIVAQMQL